RPRAAGPGSWPDSAGSARRVAALPRLRGSQWGPPPQPGGGGLQHRDRSGGVRRAGGRRGSADLLDRYLGDGILAHFEGEDRAARALRAARGVLRALDVLNTTHPDRQPVAIGIALHAGTVLVGSIGAPARGDYALVGDADNVNARVAN